MFRKLLPRRDLFFDFFEKHAHISFQAAEELALFTSANQNSVEIFERIRDFEHEGDKITHQCVEVLHKTFITPMDRMDIYRLITTLDDVIDEMEDIAKLIVLYKLEHLTEKAGQLATLLVSSTKEMQLAVIELRKMRMTPVIRAHFFNINHLENEADAIYMQALRGLFEEEGDVKTLIKWKEIYDHFEESIDVCEDVSNILEGIILENE